MVTTQGRDINALESNFLLKVPMGFDVWRKTFSCSAPEIEFNVTSNERYLLS